MKYSWQIQRSKWAKQVGWVGQLTRGRSASKFFSELLEGVTCSKMGLKLSSLLPPTGSNRVNWQLFTLELDDLNTLTIFPVLYFYSHIFSFSSFFCVPPELCEAFHPLTLEQAWAFLVPGWCEVYEILIGSYVYHIKHCQRHNGPMLCHICAVLNVFLASIQTSMLQIH